VERWLGEFPFLIAVAAGALAYACGLMLRRGLALAGGTRPPAWPADGLRGLGVLSWLAAFLWAWSLGPRPGRFGVITTLGTFSPAALSSKELTTAGLALTIACWLLMIAGAVLVAWSLAARIRNGLFGKSPDRLAQRPPYHRVRRPMTMGVGVVLLGATLLAGTFAAWVCLLTVALAALVLQEIDERESRARLPWLAEQHRRIPRFLPRRT
jgi:protein-S-isoprenylcysteine O-methyltransferase Ste14